MNVRTLRNNSILRAAVNARSCDESTGNGVPSDVCCSTEARYGLAQEGIEKST